MNFVAFEKWMRSRKFAETTVATTLIDLATLLKRIDLPAPLRPTFCRVVYRLLPYAEETGDTAAAEIAQRADARLRAEKPKRHVGGHLHRPRVSKGIDDASWEKLVTHIRETPGLALRVLEIMAETGLRANDVLQIRPTTVKRALDVGSLLTIVQKGGKKRSMDLRGADAAWKRLVKEVGDWDYTADTTLAQLVSPGARKTIGGPFGPYQKVRRTLLAVCKDVDVTERVWTHRFRHTFATHIADATGDVRLVRDALGHAGMKTVERYMGEAKPEAIARAAAAISVRKRPPK